MSEFAHNCMVIIPLKESSIKNSLILDSFSISTYI
jgi:hypothetical protein